MRFIYRALRPGGGHVAASAVLLVLDPLLVFLPNKSVLDAHSANMGIPPAVPSTFSRGEL